MNLVHADDSANGAVYRELTGTLEIVTLLSVAWFPVCCNARYEVPFAKRRHRSTWHGGMVITMVLALHKSEGD